MVCSGKVNWVLPDLAASTNCYAAAAFNHQRLVTGACLSDNRTQSAVPTLRRWLGTAVFMPRPAQSEWSCLPSPPTCRPSKIVAAVQCKCALQPHGTSAIANASTDLSAPSCRSSPSSSLPRSPSALWESSLSPPSRSGPSSGRGMSASASACSRDSHQLALWWMC